MSIKENNKYFINSINESKKNYGKIIKNTSLDC
jgi:hypothetical protein